jgi:drug/metabolite transporter (DMT)-like permease
MPDSVLPAPLVVVLLALGAAASWGVSDFGGGLLGRRAPVLGVLVVTQGVGFLIAFAIMVARAEPILAGQDLGLALVAGLLGTVGVGALYRGLAVGRMGIVAPVAAVLTAVTPALLGMLLEGVPSALVVAGMGVAIAADTIVSAVPGVDPLRPSGLALAIPAGVSLGLLSFVMSRLDGAYLFAPLAAMRGIETAIFFVVILAGGQPWKLPKASWHLAIGVGLVDLIGNAAFLLAARISLAPTAVVSSLYSVVTVLLAATILRERMTRRQAAGIALAATSVVMIAAGSGG